MVAGDELALARHESNREYTKPMAELAKHEIDTEASTYKHLSRNTALD